MYTTMNWSAHLPTEFNKALEKAVGFETMLDRLFAQPQTSGGYPPYNLRKEGDYKYILELAVAGFTEDQLEVNVADGVLTVGTVKDLEPAEMEFVHKGIATRAFTRKFTLSDDLIVQGADLKNGMLTITMERVIPEEKKPRTIKIGAKPSKKISE
tara:strand:- start:990 stop:1454 length:465 start_codon:yes stop_codon:yes gene_type:complete